MLKASWHPQGVVNTDQASTSSLKPISFCKIKAYFNANTKILNFKGHLSKLLCSDKISVATLNWCCAIYLQSTIWHIYRSIFINMHRQNKTNYSSCFITDDRSEWKVFNNKRLKPLKLCKVSSSKLSQNTIQEKNICFLQWSSQLTLTILLQYGLCLFSAI